VPQKRGKEIGKKRKRKEKEGKGAMKIAGE